MSRRGDIILKSIDEAIAAIDDVENAIVTQARQMPSPHRSVLAHMRDTLHGELCRRRDLYSRHIIHAAQRGGARFLR
jgi:hypothetical protein